MRKWSELGLRERGERTGKYKSGLGIWLGCAGGDLRTGRDSAVERGAIDVRGGRRGENFDGSTGG